MAAPSEQELARYQGFLATLRADLARAQEARSQVQEEIQAYEDLRSNAELLEQEGLRSLKTLVHLGSGVHAQARVPDASHLYVAVGLGFHAELTPAEARAAATLRLERLRTVAVERSARVAGIKAHIALVEQGLAGLEGRAPLA